MDVSIDILSAEMNIDQKQYAALMYFLDYNVGDKKPHLREDEVSERSERVLWKTRIRATTILTLFHSIYFAPSSLGAELRKKTTNCPKTSN